MEGLARSAVISYQARPRDISNEAESFQNYQNLMIDPVHPPWGRVEHPGWSSPASPDLPDLPYRTVIRELPNLIEAKAVSLAPADMLASALSRSIPRYTRGGSFYSDLLPWGLRQYIKRLTSLGAIDPPELGAEFLALYERARFSSHELQESEFRDLMHLFAEILRGMMSLTTPVLDEIRDSASFRRADSESFLGPSDEEGETDTVDQFGYDGPFTPIRTNSLRPSNASTWETRSGYATAPATQSPASTRSPGGGYFARELLRTPSTRSLRRVQSVQSGSSGGSVIRLTQTRSPTDLPYTFNYAGRRN